MRKQNSHIALQRSVAFFAALFACSIASAHVGAGDAHGLMHGFMHPVTGLDHVAAMVAVGLWAAQLGGRAVWVVPASFVSLMAVGGALGEQGIYLPFVEAGIAASVLVLGLAIAGAIRLPLTASAALVGVFALFHGHAHGTEMPEDATGLLYGIGFMIGSALLHVSGILLGLSAQKMASPKAIQIAGAAIAAMGVYLNFA